LSEKAVAERSVVFDDILEFLISRYSRGFASKYPPP
jgi:hypothetical protein